jgi:hypothetical protein
MKKRKIFIIASLVILGVLIVVSLFLKKEEEIAPPLPQPKIPSLLEGAYPVETFFEQQDFNFPSKISALKLEKTLLQNQDIANIASNLGFPVDPLIMEDVFDGKMYIYRSEESALTVSLKNQEFDYTLNTVPAYINKQPSDAALINTAKDFLTQMGFVSSEDIRFESFIYLKETSGQGLYPTNKENAMLYQVNFSSVVVDTTILTLNPQNTPVYVRLLPDGSVFKAHVNRLGTISKSTTQYKLKTYDEVISKINDVILISLDDGNVHLPDISNKSIKKISIYSIELAYLLDTPTSETLQPVFLLKGTADISGFPTEVSASMYLPAISSN